MKKIWALIMIVSLLGSLLSGCSKSEDSTTSITDTQFKFNTIMTITIYGYNDQAIFKDIWAKFDAMEQSFSANIDTSDVSKFNASKSTEPMAMPSDILTMLDKALPFSEKTGGRFDPTIEPIVRLWGITTDNPRVPEQAEIDAALKHVGYQHLKLDLTKGTLQKDDPDVRIDLGAIAKGYAADQIAAYLKSRDIDRAILNLGGNIYALGSKTSSTPWNVGVQNPMEPSGDVLATIKVINKSVVTSGTYERYFEKDGKRYHHILSPFDGYPINNELVSVSIISDQSIEGDILSTSAYALGLEKGQALINSLSGIAAVFVTTDKKIYFAGDKSLLESFELQKDGFEMVK